MLSIQLFNKLSQFGYYTAVFCDCSIPVQISNKYFILAFDEGNEEADERNVVSTGLNLKQVRRGLSQMSSRW